MSRGSTSDFTSSSSGTSDPIDYHTDYLPDAPPSCNNCTYTPLGLALGIGIPLGIPVALCLLYFLGVLVCVCWANFWTGMGNRKAKRASGIRRWWDCEDWEVFRSLNERMGTWRRDRGKKKTEVDVDVEMGDIDIEKRRGSRSMDDEGGMEEGGDEKEKAEDEVEEKKTSSSSLAIHFFKHPLRIFSSSPQTPSLPPSSPAESEHEKQARIAKEKRDREYETFIEEVRTKCSIAANVLAAKTEEERTRMDLPWIRENREVWHKCSKRFERTMWDADGRGWSGWSDLCEACKR